MSEQPVSEFGVWLGRITDRGPLLTNLSSPLNTESVLESAIIHQDHPALPAVPWHDSVTNRRTQKRSTPSGTMNASLGSSEDKKGETHKAKYQTRDEKYKEDPWIEAESVERSTNVTFSEDKNRTAEPDDSECAQPEEAIESLLPNIIHAKALRDALNPLFERMDQSASFLVGPGSDEIRAAVKESKNSMPNLGRSIDSIGIATDKYRSSREEETKRPARTRTIPSDTNRWTTEDLKWLADMAVKRTTEEETRPTSPSRQFQGKSPLETREGRHLQSESTIQTTDAAQGKSKRPKDGDWKDGTARSEKSAQDTTKTNKIKETGTTEVPDQSKLLSEDTFQATHQSRGKHTSDHEVHWTDDVISTLATAQWTTADGTGTSSAPDKSQALSKGTQTSAKASGKRRSIPKGVWPTKDYKPISQS